MNPQDINIEQIERFLLKKMEAKEQAIFEEEMAQSSDLKSEVNDYKKLKSGFDTLADQSFLAKMQAWDEAATTSIKGEKNDNAAAFKSKKPKIHPLFRRLAIAASVLFLISVGIKWYTSLGESPEEIAQTYYKMPTAGNVQGNGDAPSLSAWENKYAEAHALFGENKTVQAAQLFDELFTAIPDAHLNSSEISRFKDETKWYQALAILKTGKNIPQAKIILQGLKDHSTSKYYVAKAAELLLKLDGF